MIFNQKEGHMVKGHFGIVKSKGYQEISNIYDLALGKIISPIKLCLSMNYIRV